MRHSLDPSPPPVPRSTRPALIGWYGAFVGGTALSPWLAVLLMDGGWSSAAASLLLTALPAGRLVVIPVWAWVADRYGAEGVVRATLAISALGALTLSCADDRWLVFGAMLVWALARSPPIAIVDASTMAVEGRGYGRIRAVGSLAYLVVSAVSGVARETWPRGPAIVSVVLAFSALALAFRLPALAPAPRGDLRSAMRGLVRHPILVPLVGLSVAHGASFTIAETLFAVHVQQMGFGPTVTGAALALGVGLEVLVLTFGRRLLDQVGPLWLLVVAVGTTIPRFALTAFAPDIPWLLAAQALHGLNFGCWWLAGTALVSDHAPANVRNSAQALLPTAAFGAGPLIGLGLAAIILAFGDTRTLFTWAIALSVIGLVFVAILARGLRRR